METLLSAARRLLAQSDKDRAWLLADRLRPMRVAAEAPSIRPANSAHLSQKRNNKMKPRAEPARVARGRAYKSLVNNL